MPEIGTPRFDEAGPGNVVTAAGLRPGAKATEKPPEPKDWRARPRPYYLPVHAGLLRAVAHDRASEADAVCRRGQRRRPGRPQERRGPGGARHRLRARKRAPAKPPTARQHSASGP